MSNAIICQDSVKARRELGYNDIMFNRCVILASIIASIGGCGGVLHESPNPDNPPNNLEMSEAKAKHESKLWINSTTQKALYLRVTSSCTLRLLISLKEEGELTVKFYKRDYDGHTTMADIMSSDVGFIIKDVDVSSGEQVVLEFFSASPRDSGKQVSTWIECLDKGEGW